MLDGQQILRITRLSKATFAVKVRNEKKNTIELVKLELQNDTLDELS